MATLEKKVIEKLGKSKEKTNKTFYVSVENYSKFEEKCKKLGLKISQVVDTLIEEFTKEDK